MIKANNEMIDSTEIIDDELKKLNKWVYFTFLFKFIMIVFVAKEIITFGTIKSVNVEKELYKLVTPISQYHPWREWC